MPQPRRLRALSALVAVLSLAVAACGGGGDPLEPAELKTALLTVDNLGTGWVQQPEADELSAATGTGQGCLEDAGELEAIEPLDKASTSFAYTAGTLSIANGVGAYEDAEQVTTQFDETFASLEDCNEVTNEAGGATMEAKISSDQVASADGVDSQLNIAANGSFTTQGQTQPFAILITLAQVGANVTTVQTIGAADITAAHKTYVDIAVARLLAVTEGEEPAQTVAPTPELG